MDRREKRFLNLVLDGRLFISDDGIGQDLQEGVLGLGKRARLFAWRCPVPNAALLVSFLTKGFFLVSPDGPVILSKS